MTIPEFLSDIRGRRDELAQIDGALIFEGEYQKSDRDALKFRRLELKKEARR